ncbi:AraC family transcriptional regulator [Pseudomonas sp. Je.1.5.c]|uniref:helix-turn-helix transcriptional regulator n=1 Tax=Pseudomonas sp. Je.1.5.c TaxID=3142839 RepID=UPI003DA8C3A3
MQQPTTILRGNNLSEFSGGRTRLIDQSDGDTALFEGRISWSHLRDGLMLQCTDCTELENVVTECYLEPHLVLVVLLEGSNQLHYDKQRVDFHAPPSLAGQPQGLAVVGTEPMVFRGFSKKGRRVRRVAINIGAQWFDSAGLDSKMLDELLHISATPLAAHQWTPSVRLQATVAQLLNPPDYTPILQRFYLESRVLDVAVEALASFTPSQGSSSLKPHEHRRMQQLLALLDSGDADEWSLEQIARSVGVNMCSLQKHFRHLTGTTVFDYQRNRRLAVARRALEREGATVSQAAWLAGYSSAANFATAFKRRFGITPKQVVGRI